MDTNGQIFTIDALFALLLITVLIGFSANTMGIVDNKIQEYSSEQAIQRIAVDMVDILIKTPGAPDNWENYKYLKDATPGLADIENGTNKFGNKLSMRKITSLKANPELIKQLLPAGMDCNLMIYPINTSLPAIEVINKNPPNGDVTVVNRTVLFDYKLIDVYSCITPCTHGNGQEYVCIHSTNQHLPPDFKNGKSGWLCAAFCIDSEDIKSKDFYILTDPEVNDVSYSHLSWILDKPNKTILYSQNFTSNPIVINSIISELSEKQKREIFVLHVFLGGDIKKTFKTYIVGVPRGTSTKYVRLDNINPQPGFFIMKLWMK